MIARKLTFTTALVLVSASSAGAVEDVVKAMQLPVLGPVSCSSGGSGGSDPLQGSNCYRSIRPSGDVAVWGEYANELDRAGSVNAGTDLLLLNSGSSRLEFDLDNNDRLFVDSSSLFLVSEGGWTEVTVGKDNGGSVAQVNIGPNALLETQAENAASIMRIGENGTGQVSLYESGLNLNGHLLSYMQLGADGGTGALNIGTNAIGYTSTVHLLSDGGDAAMELGLDGNGTVNVGAGELKIESLNNDAIMAFGTNGGTGTLNLDRLGSQVRLNAINGDARIVAGASDGGLGQINISGGNLGLFDLDNTSEIFLGANNVDPFNTGAGTTSPGGTGVMNVSGTSPTEMGSVFANTFYVGVSASGVGIPVGGTGQLNVGANGLVQADEMYVGQIQIAGGGESAGQVHITNGGVVNLFEGSSEMIIGANGGVLVDGNGSTLRSDSILLEGSSFDDAVLKVGNGGTVDLYGTGVLTVGAGGVLMGDEGNIDGKVVLDGGSLLPGASPGTLNIFGDLTLNSGIIELEFGGTGAGEYDILNIHGDLFLPTTGTVSMVMKFLDGFMPQASDTFEFLNVTGATPSLAGLDISFEGLSGDVPSLFGDGLGSFSLGFSDPYTGDNDPGTSPVPLPAGVWMMLTALGGLMGMRGRGRRRIQLA